MLPIDFRGFSKSVFNLVAIKQTVLYIETVEVIQLFLNITYTHAQLLTHQSCGVRDACALHLHHNTRYHAHAEQLCGCYAWPSRMAGERVRAHGITTQNAVINTLGEYCT